MPDTEGKGTPAVAERLKALLERKGVSISGAAELAGMERQQVHRIVSGATPNPGIATVERIVYAVGGTMRDLYRGESSRHKRGED